MRGATTGLLLVMACGGTVTGGDGGIGDGDGSAVTGDGGCPGQPPPPTPVEHDPVFSVSRGFYDQPVEVALSAGPAAAEIRYTTDGTEPDLADGQLYETPITVSQSTVVRARAFVDGAPLAPSVAHTYLMTADFPADVLDALSELPILSLGMAPADFEVQNSEGSGSIGSSGDNKEWERPASVELFYPDGAGGFGPGFQVNGGIRPHSWVAPKRAYKLVFKSEYGPSELRYPLFESAPQNAESATWRFERLVLRQSSNDGWAGRWGAQAEGALYLRDQFARDSQVAASGLGPRGTYVHLFVNGEYRGLYNPVERPDHDFLSAYLGGSASDYYAMNHGGTISGDDTRFARMHQLARESDLSDPAAYQEFSQYLDVARFADYLLVSFYCTNPSHDWPVNNGRPQNYYAGNRNDPPGGVRYFVWDAEFCFAWDAAVHDNFRPENSGSDEVFIPVWFALLASDDFRMLWADRAHALLGPGGALSPAHARARLDALAAHIDGAVNVAEAWRWGADGRSWADALADARARTDSNPGSLIGDMRALGYYPTLDPPTLSIEPGSANAGDEVEVGNSNDSGALYYTTDGSDPRLSGGALAPGATAADGGSAAVTLNEDTVLIARIRDGDQWSARARISVARAPSCQAF